MDARWKTRDDADGVSGRAAAGKGGAGLARRRGRWRVGKGTAGAVSRGLGIHRFCLGPWWGLFYLLFVWTFIPSCVAFIEGIVFLCTRDAQWEAKYGCD